MSLQGEIKKIIRATERRGWRHEMGGRHHKLIHPSGAVVAISVSPSCIHAAKNIIRDINKILKEKGEAGLQC